MTLEPHFYKFRPIIGRKPAHRFERHESAGFSVYLNSNKIIAESPETP